MRILAPARQQFFFSKKEVLTVDTSNSTTDNFRIRDLQMDIKRFPENEKLIQEAAATIMELVSNLKPILRCIAKPLSYFRAWEPLKEILPDRGIIVVDSRNECLLLTEKTFMAGHRFAGTPPGLWEIVNENNSSFGEFGFSDIIQGLEQSLTNAHNIQEKYLKSLNDRLTLVQEIRTLINQRRT